jgi:hypothetical protein
VPSRRLEARDGLAGIGRRDVPSRRPSHGLLTGAGLPARWRARELRSAISGFVLERDGRRRFEADRSALGRTGGGWRCRRVARGSADARRRRDGLHGGSRLGRPAPVPCSGAGDGARLDRRARRSATLRGGSVVARPHVRRLETLQRRHGDPADVMRRRDDPHRGSRARQGRPRCVPGGYGPLTMGRPRKKRVGEARWQRDRRSAGSENPDRLCRRGS